MVEALTTTAMKRTMVFLKSKSLGVKPSLVRQSARTRVILLRAQCRSSF